MKVPMEKPIILAIVGDSGVGKTTLALYLQEVLGINNICSYTTRCPREGEKSGIDHWFVHEQDVPNLEDTLAYTYFAGAHYWTMPHQAYMHPVNTYVIDERGLIDLREKWDEAFQIIGVKVTRPNNPTDEERKSRDCCRVEYSDYQLILENNSTLTCFLETSASTINHFLAILNEEE